MRLLSLALALAITLTAAPVYALAAPAAGEAADILQDIESRYSIGVTVEDSGYWDAGYIAGIRDALDAFPPGMVEQALEFFHMMSGSKPHVYLKRENSGHGDYLAVTTHTGRYVVTVDVFNRNGVTATFAHELVHIFHFYIMDNFGDARLPKIYDALNGELGYVGGDCFDARYRGHIGVYFPSAYAMHDYMEDVAELFSMLCLDPGLYGRYGAAGVPLSEKSFYTANELMRRVISPLTGAHGAQWRHDVFDDPREFSRISAGLSDWALGPYKQAMEANLLPPDDFLSDRPREAMTRLDYSFFAARLIEASTGGSLHRLAVSLGAGSTFGRRSRLPYGDIPEQDRADVYSNLFYLYELDIMQGVGDSNFAPGMTLTRAQAAGLLTNVAKALGVYSEPPAAVYADAHQIPYWALDGVAFMTYIGVMEGTGGGNFSPNEPYSYEQGLISILNMYNWLASRSMILSAAA
ncbi:MAG: S-layer homology domain-containing protein [Oscillospiraceae bacterium]|nr:S-layer homology domain-containing protein [Oscillospiraceae bacterium]